jgi:hypothetical protein
MVDEIGSFVPMPYKFSGEFFCNTYVGGVATVLQCKFPGRWV